MVDRLIKCCHFCKNDLLNECYLEDEIIQIKIDGASHDNKYRVTCPLCGACGPWDWSVEGAIDNWNNGVNIL